jgi:hypothetical protein
MTAFSGTNPYARTYVARSSPELVPGPARSLRSIRSRTRRRLHEPRPAVPRETCTRIGQWKAEVRAACLAGCIGKGDDKYALELLAIPSVARGDYCLYSDAAMGRRINISGRTVRRHRKALADQGLIEVLGHGKDRKPCMVRPILRDGSPVFLDPKLAGRSDTNGRLTRPVLAAELLFTEEPKDSPPLPPVEPDVAEEGGGASDQVEDQPAAQIAPQAPAEASGLEEAPTQPPGAENAPAGSGEASLAPGAEPAVPAMSFLAFWVAMGQTGREGYARAQWGNLTVADKAAIRDRLSRPRSWAADMWAGKWLECRVWEEAVPAARPERVWLHERTPEWRCWQRHLGRDIPVDNRGGWWFSSRLPPLTNVEVSSKGRRA